MNDSLSPVGHRRVFHAVSGLCFSAAILLVAILPGVASAHHGRVSAAGCAWHRVAAPSPSGYVQLYGVDALAGNNIWAVGSKSAAGATLVEHYNGSKWSAVASPNKSGFTELEAVSALSGKNVWAVGYYVPKGAGKQRTLTEHYNGRRWSVVSSPNPLAGKPNILKGVYAVSPSNVWAVGSNGFPGNRTIIEHWTGSKWVVVHGAGINGDLADVSAVSKSNVTAVGHIGPVGSSQPLVEEFNGSHWNLAPLANTGTNGKELLGVSTPAANARWAAGDQSGSAAIQTFTMRRAPTAWQPESGVNVGSGVNLLRDVSALSAGKAFSVGYHENSSFRKRSLVERFESGHWSVMASPNAGSLDNVLNDVVALGGSKVWAVGTSNQAIGSHALVEQYHC